MADKIGRADWELRADQSGLVKDLADAEGKVGASGQRVEKSATGTGLAFKAGAAVAAVGFGLMAKGALEMEKAQGNFQAATGRSREEAIQFSKDMNGLVGTAGTVGKSFDQIADAGIAVSQQFGITGQDATDLTGDILAFSKVTGQDAAQAAFDLEDALSSYGMEAKDASGIMDILVASNQKFGTDAGPATVNTLKSMAPALQAMGADMSDGIALLNAFEVAGVDASAAQRGLNSAITNLPAGQTLEGFIQHLQDLKDQGIDPTSAAIDVFGNKAGAALALTIKPGGDALDGFRVTAEEAAGGVDQAAEDMLTTSDKIRMFTDKVGAALRGLGQDLGPMLSGLGGVASLAAALPSSLTKPLTDGLKNVWTKVASSGPIKAVVGLAGAAASAAYQAGMKVADAIGGALTGAWSMVTTPGGPVMRAATAAGSMQGTAMGTAMKLGLVVGLAAAAPEIEEALRPIAKSSGRAFFGMFGDESKGLASGTIFDSLADNFHVMWDRIGANDPLRSAANKALSDVWIYATQQQLDPAPLEAAYHAAIEAGLDPKAAYEAAIKVGSGITEGLASQIASERADFVAVGADVAGAVGEGIVGGAPVMTAATAEALRGVELAARGQGIDAGAAAGVALTEALAKATTSAEATHSLKTGIDQLKDAIENYLSPREQALELIGSDYIKTLRNGMNSADPALRIAAQDLAIGAIATIEEAGLTGKKGQKGLKQIGVLYDELLASGMTSEQVRTELSAAGVASDVIDAMMGKPILDEAGTAGANVGAAWVSGLAGKIGSRGARVQIIQAAKEATRDLYGSSPPKTGPLHEIDKWGENVAGAWVQAFAGRISAGAREIGSALGGYGSLSPALAGGGLAAAGGAGGFSMGDINVNVSGVDAPGEVGDAVAGKVRAALDEFMIGAQRGSHLRWSEV